MEKGVSVIICCYNSSSRLPETIKHIAEQEVSEFIDWEVIVVNNNSTDDTFFVAKNEWNKYNCNIDFKIIDEPKQGLSNARKTGVHASKYSYILFCDDDNWLNNNYLNNAHNIMESNPSIGVLGGDCIAVSDTDFPDWFENVKENYAVGKQFNNSGDITNRGFVWGAGAIYRSQLLLHFYNCDIESLLLGRNGKDLSSGDDAEICQWYIMAGYKLWYNESLVLEHFIPQERLTKSYYKKLYAGQCKSMHILNIYFEITKKVLKIPTFYDFFYSWSRIILYLFKRDYNSYQHWWSVQKLYLTANFNSKSYLYKVYKINNKILAIKSKNVFQ